MDYPSSSDDDIVTVLAAVASYEELARDATASATRKKGGSAPGRVKFVRRKRVEGSINIDRDYFCRMPCHSCKTPLFEHDFSRRYRMSRAIYETVRSGLLAQEGYFVEKPDATGLPGATADQKITAAMRMLSLGVAADACVEYTRLGESTIANCLREFCQGVVRQFGAEWLRLPDVDEMKKLSKEFGDLGFPGCLGSVDCASWEWDACPVGWQGQCKGKDKCPTVRMEVVCDDFLRIWHLNFGSPGAKNDIQIFHQSNLFNRMRTGAWPPVLGTMKVEELYVDWSYFLCDGVYPKLRFVISTFGSPKDEREKFFAQQQEGVRKAVERVFGVLFKKYQILYRPSRLWNVVDMDNVVKACVIMHNMCCEERRSTFTGSRVMRVRLDETEFPEPDEFVTFISPPPEDSAQSLFWSNHLVGVEEQEQHFALKKALKDHLWKRRAAIYNETA